MAKKDDPIADARKRQAEIVAEQEAVQSVAPTPSQDEADRAKLGLINEFNAPTETDEKSETASKPGSYKTRSSAAD